MHSSCISIEMKTMKRCVHEGLPEGRIQFGFKEKIGSVDAIFTLKSTVEYFTNRGSSIYVTSLDRLFARPFTEFIIINCTSRF